MITPRYCPIITILSGFPRQFTVIQMGNVKMIEKTTNAQVAKNLLNTIFHKGIGKVIRSSIVPNLFSSDQLFIVTADTKKIKTQGIKLKNIVKSATPEEKKDPK